MTNNKKEDPLVFLDRTLRSLASGRIGLSKRDQENLRAAFKDAGYDASRPFANRAELLTAWLASLSPARSQFMCELIRLFLPTKADMVGDFADLPEEERAERLRIRISAKLLFAIPNQTGRSAWLSRTLGKRYSADQRVFEFEDESDLVDLDRRLTKIVTAKKHAQNGTSGSGK